MSKGFDDEGAAQRDAISGGIPALVLYQKSIDYDPSFSGSANHKMQSNTCAALVALNRHQPETLDAYRSWAAHYVQPGNPLHENEAFCSHSYRPAITTGTWLLAGIAHELGDTSTRDTALARCRADIAWIVLGVAVTTARIIREHFLNDQNVAHLFVGDGAPDRVAGIDLPTFAQAGKRSHQRAGGTGNHWGPLEGTNNSALSALVAQAIGAPSPADFRRLFDAARHRWPELPPYGLSPNDVAVLKALIRNPTDVLIAQAVYKMARDFRPLEPFAFVRYDDGAVETFARETKGSSTGAKAVETVLADGTHYIGSADTGHRLAPAVQPQTVIETGVALLCQWQSGGPVLRVPRPRGREIYRIETTRDGSRFLVSGVETIQTLEPEPPPITQPVTPKPKKENKWTGWL